MAKQTFTTGQVLTAAQMTDLQATAMGGGAANTKTANYVLVAADAGTTVAMNAAGATTITVNTGLFSAGDTVFIQNIGAGVCTITAGTATVDTAGDLALPQYNAGILYFISASAAIFYDYVQAGGGGGMTLLSTTALSGASVSVTSISAAYTDLLIIVSMLSTSSDGIITGTLNSDTTGGVYQLNNAGNASIPFTRGLNNDSAGTSAQNWVTTVSQYASTTFHKPLSITAGFVNAATGSQVTYADGGAFKSNTAVSSFQIATSAGTFDRGNIYIYGVK